MRHGYGMNLYVITQPDGGDFDEVNGFVIAATDETEARLLACERPGDEGGHVWVDPKLSECHLIGYTAVVGQDAGILMRDFHNG